MLQSVVRGISWRKTSSTTAINAFYRNKSQTSSVFYDVVVSGSGLIGGAMACALGSSRHFENKKILVLETQPEPSQSSFDDSTPYSNRVCAISPASKNLLDSLGAWEQISRKSAVKKMQIWDACSNAMLQFGNNNMDEDLCYIIENGLITKALTALLHEQYNENIDIKYKSKMSSCTLPRNYAREDVNDPIPNVILQMENKDIYETNLLIAADGANSSVAKDAKISKISWEYGQSGVVATLRLSEPLENIVAWQRFLPTGPIAMLPLNEEYSSLVWSTSHDHASELMEMGEDEFITSVNNAFFEEYKKDDLVTSAERIFQSTLDTILTGINQKGDPDHKGAMQLPPIVSGIQGSRAKFPLGLNHCAEYVRPRMVLVGDAAHRVHPLAGQGANLGFGDVECLLRILNKAAYEGKDIGCISHLMDFESERQLRNVSVMGVIDMLQKLYSTSSVPVVLLRSLGLMATNTSSFVKNAIINQAAA